MKTFPSLSALLTVASISLGSLVVSACAAPAGAPEASETIGTTAQPLLETCVGTYTRASEDGKSVVALKLETAHGSCKAGELHLGGDHTITVAATGEPINGTWSGDTNAFVLCTDQHCLQWQKSVTSGER